MSFPAVPQYFNPVSVGPLLNQLDFPDFAWRTKNSFWYGLNVLKKEVVCQEKQPMITDRNQVPFAKMSGCGLQEVLYCIAKRESEGRTRGESMIGSKEFKKCKGR